MSFLRRLLGGDGDGDGDAGPPLSQADLDAAEREYEQGLLRAEAERLDDLRTRQLRYAEHAWTPPDQGGRLRAGSADAGSESGAAGEEAGPG